MDLESARGFGERIKLLNGEHRGGNRARNQALAHASSADVKQRRAAVDRLGQVGLMSDARVLLKALHDRDEATRELAEASIWQVWSPVEERNGCYGTDTETARGE